MKKIVLITLIIFSIISCSPKKKEVVKSKPKDYKSELNSYVKANFYTILSKSIKVGSGDSIQWVSRFYKDNNFHVLWFTDSIRLNADGYQLIRQLSNAERFGIEPKFYPVSELQKLENTLANTNFDESKYDQAAQLELMLSYYYMLHGKHLNYGVLPVIDSISALPRKEIKINFPEYLKKAHASDSLMHKLLALQPKHEQYHKLRKGLEMFLDSSSLSTSHIEVVNFREDSLKAIDLSKKALVLHNYLPQKFEEADYYKALTKFQKDHGLKPDSIIGKNTAKALSISPYEYYKKIVAGLERWRWKENWSDTFIYVNVPAYKLELYENKELVNEHKVVVGTVRNKTPEIIDELEYIIAYPYWHVPRKISVEEILIKAKKDSTYLKRNNYDVLSKSREKIDPNSVDWNLVNADNFDYYIRQQGGSSNALGMVKFIFPNKYSIYLHDTPTKYHFNFETRAYSHGCIRVHKALDLAEEILKFDDNSYNLDSIYTYIDKKKEKPILLNNKIPVYIYYLPVEADKNGHITFYEDIYGLDEKLIKQLITVGN